MLRVLFGLAVYPVCNKLQRPLVTVQRESHYVLCYACSSLTLLYLAGIALELDDLALDRVSYRPTLASGVAGLTGFPRHWSSPYLFDISCTYFLEHLSCKVRVYSVIHGY